jgi:hypothetical protein
MRTAACVPGTSTKAVVVYTQHRASALAYDTTIYQRLQLWLKLLVLASTEYVCASSSLHVTFLA